MPRRRKPQHEQLVLGAVPANTDAVANHTSLDDVLGPARVVGGAAPRGRSRAAAGRHAQRVGAALEAWLRAQLQAAVLARVITWFTKIEAGAKYAPRRDPATGTWSKELTWAERAAADFIAVGEGGRAIAIECKTTDDGRLMRDAIEPQQVEHLDATHRAGGVALLVIEYRDEGALVHTARQYCVPWARVPWGIERSAWSVAEAPLTGWRVRAAEIFDRLRGR